MEWIEKNPTKTIPKNGWKRYLRFDSNFLLMRDYIRDVDVSQIPGWLWEDMSFSVYELGAPRGEGHSVEDGWAGLYQIRRVAED